MTPKGKHIEVQIDDSSEPVVDEIVTTKVERFPYRVLVECGIFKNGKHYAQGEIVELTEQSAAAFIEIGEVEPA